MYSTPSIEDFKAFFSRDFPYGTDVTSIVDGDISKAFTIADTEINQAIWENQSVFTLAYMYLSAHEMVKSLQASSQGISGQYPWLRQSKSVGGVSESSAFPPEIVNDPFYASMADTYYGAKYLSMLILRSVGTMSWVPGMTH
jgi:hypothetical protein